MGTKSIETERLLTDKDFKAIRRLKKRAAEDREAQNEKPNAGPAMHMPNFDFMEERERLKKMTAELKRAENALDHEDYGMEEADDELEGDEEDMEGGEEMDLEDGEFIDESDMEEGDEEMLEEDLEGEEEMEEDEEDDEGSQEVVVQGKKIEQKPKKKETTAAKRKQEVEINSSFYDDSDSSDAHNDDPRTTFLSANAIYDPDKIKRRQTKEQIKIGKQEIREEHKKLKLGHKMKERGRLTNNLKRKNNPFQMYIAKRRLQHRLEDLKRAARNTNSKLHKGKKPRKLGKAFGGNKGR